MRKRILIFNTVILTCIIFPITVQADTTIDVHDHNYQEKPVSQGKAPNKIAEQAVNIALNNTNQINNQTTIDYISTIYSQTEDKHFTNNKLHQYLTETINYKKGKTNNIIESGRLFEITINNNNHKNVLPGDIIIYQNNNNYQFSIALQPYGELNQTIINNHVVNYKKDDELTMGNMKPITIVRPSKMRGVIVTYEDNDKDHTIVGKPLD